jgi:hypothetical protein
MSIAIVAEADSAERARCVSILARQTPLGALGASNWSELQEVLVTDCDIGLVVYDFSLPGAPPDALDALASRTSRLAVVADDRTPSIPAGATRLRQPVPAEALVLLARSAFNVATNSQTTFQPVGLVQMLCMSGESHVLVISNDDADVGVLEIRDGALWTAYDSLGAGKEAFARLMHPRMRARSSPGQGFATERTIFSSHEELIFDSLRLIDEGKVTVPPPLSAPIPAPVADIAHAVEAVEEPPKRVTDVSELVVRARRLLTERNYNEATKTLARIAERDPGSPLVRANLEQLHSLGYPND